MDKIEKLIFVCSSNTFLSPLAETIYRNNRDENMPDCASRGLVVLFPEPISPKVNEVLARAMVPPCRHKNTIQLSKKDIKKGNCILTMTLSEKVNIMEEYDFKDVFTLGEFTGMGLDIPDPYGKEDEDYIKSAEILEEAVNKTVGKIKALNSGNESVAVGSDHGGYKLKQDVIKYLEENNIPYKDFGCYDEKSCDYPVYAFAVAQAVAKGEFDKGILVCGTGIGVSMAANKVKGVRAALCHDCFSAQATREHNDANVLTMGARVIGPGLALKIVDIFLHTPFSNEERHKRRISMLDEKM